MIEFRAPLDGASPELLTRLRQAAGAAIRHTASVSPKRHAYELVCLAEDPHCDAAIHALRQDSDIHDIALDQLRKPTPRTPR